jgi:hypothetical protein
MVGDPTDELPTWLAFYRRQRDLFPDHAESYADDVKALRGAYRANPKIRL